MNLVNKKRNGERITPVGQPRDSSNVVDLKTALKRSLDGKAATVTPVKKKAKAATGQREMLLPIAGKKAAEPVAKKKPTAAANAKSELISCARRAICRAGCAASATSARLTMVLRARRLFCRSRRLGQKRAKFWDRFPVGGYATIVERWRKLDDGRIEFTMRRLPTAD